MNHKKKGNKPLRRSHLTFPFLYLKPPRHASEIYKRPPVFSTRKAVWIHTGQAMYLQTRNTVLRAAPSTAHGDATDLRPPAPLSPGRRVPERPFGSCPARCPSRCPGFSAPLDSNLLMEATKQNQIFLIVISVVYVVVTSSVWLHGRSSGSPSHMIYTHTLSL